MKAPIRQVLLETSLFIVQLSKRYLKTTSWTFNEKSAPNFQTDAFQVFHQVASRVPRHDKDRCNID